MIYDSKKAEEAAVLATAQQMCAAARTAPKTKGDDFIFTCIAAGEDIERLANEMERLGDQLGYGFFKRDAENVRDSQAVVLLGVKNQYRGLNDGCGYCRFKNCGDCDEHGGMCAYGPMDLGIAIGSAVGIAAGARIDNRVMFSAGRCALSLGFFEDGVMDVIGIPLSAKGKSPYFDRKSQRPAAKQKS